MTEGWLVSVNVNQGGVPKKPRPEGDRVDLRGLAHDRQAFAKHNKRERAVSVLSVELLDYFQREGYRVAPGIMAENLTVFGVDLVALQPGVILRFEGGVELRVESQRKPCYQLNPMGEGLEKAAVGKSGVMCSVLIEGDLRPGLRFQVITPENNTSR